MALRDRPRLVAGLVGAALTFVVVRSLLRGRINLGGGRVDDFFVTAKGSPGLYWGAVLVTSALAAGCFGYLWYTRRE